MTLATCPVCACSLGEEQLKCCPACETPHHADCWEYNKGCAIYGCRGVVTKDRRPLPAELKLRIPASSYAFAGALVNEGLARLEVRVGIWVVLLVLSICSVAFLGLNIYLAIAFLFIAYTVSSFLRDTLRLDIQNGLLLREMTLGEKILDTKQIPISSLTRISLDPCFLEIGSSHRKVVRALFSFRDGHSERAILNMESSGVTDDDLNQWSEYVRRKASLQVTKAPPPQLAVLLKRIKAFQFHLGQENAVLGKAQWYWNNRWYLLWVGLFVTSAMQVPIGGAIFTALFFLGLIFGLTTFFTFFRPFELLRSLTGKSKKVNPYPDPLMFYNEDENLSKLGAFLTTVEEKEFLATMPEKSKVLLRKAVVVLTVATPFLYICGSLIYLWRYSLNYSTYSAIEGGWLTFCMVLSFLVAGLGALLNRANWEEEWARGWLASSRASLEQLDEYKRKEEEQEEELIECQ